MNGERVVAEGAWKLTEDYIRSLGRLAYLWGWPLVNMHNRLSIMSQLPGRGLLDGVVLAASPGSIGMLHDYITPDDNGRENLGLGLSIVNAIAAAHDATLTAHASPDGGLDIEIVFPATC